MKIKHSILNNYNIELNEESVVFSVKVNIKM